MVVVTDFHEPFRKAATEGLPNALLVEGLNSIIKKHKRVATGFRRFDHYRTRILLAIGGVNWNLLDPARL
jgi:hypothetical protein